VRRALPRAAGIPPQGRLGGRANPSALPELDLPVQWVETTQMVVETFCTGVGFRPACFTPPEDGGGTDDDRCPVIRQRRRTPEQAEVAGGMMSLCPPGRTTADCTVNACVRVIGNGHTGFVMEIDETHKPPNHY
jgi:hypothetical protein